MRSAERVHLPIVPSKSNAYNENKKKNASTLQKVIINIEFFVVVVVLLSSFLFHFFDHLLNLTCSKYMTKQSASKWSRSSDQF